MPGVKLNTRQRRALMIVGSEPYGASPARLAYLLPTSRAGAIRTASSLVRRGLVVRHRDRDGRVFYVPAAPRG